MNTIQKIWDESTYKNISIIDVIIYTAICGVTFGYMVDPNPLFEIVYGVITFIAVIGLFGYMSFMSTFIGISNNDIEPTDEILERVKLMFNAVKLTPIARFIERFTIVFACCTFYIGAAYGMLIVTMSIRMISEYNLYKIHKHTKV